MKKGFKISEDIIRNKNFTQEGNHYNDISDFGTLEIFKREGDKLIFNGEDIIDNWFPNQEGKNVFISHSHVDSKLVSDFSEYLFSKGFNPFIDFNVWGNCSNLIKRFNDEFNSVVGEDNSYYYQESQYISENIYLMLTVALNKMINQCDIFLFIHSGESIKGKSTYSPWIMEELNLYAILNQFNFDIQKSIGNKTNVYNKVLIAHKVENILTSLFDIVDESEFNKMNNFINR